MHTKNAKAITRAESQHLGEAWVPVRGWETFYEVSDRGRVRSLVRIRATSMGPRPYGGAIVSPITGTRGYPVVNLTADGRRVQAFVHKLVLESFLRQRLPHEQTCHNDGDRSNAILSNLRWDTAVSNHADKYLHGTAQIGARGSNAKLSEEIVREIRRKKLTATEARRQYGALPGLSDTNVKRIAGGGTWKNVHAE